MKKFDIDHQWQFYLQLMELDVAKMPIDQVVEMKRAFIAGISNLLTFIVVTLEDVEESEAITALDNLKQTLELFWLAEIKRSM